MAWEISVSLRASLGTSSALCPPHMSLRKVQTDSHMQTDRQMENNYYREGETAWETKRQKIAGKKITTSKRPAVWPTERSFAVSLLALGHYLSPQLHHVLLLICHSARGPPAHLSRGPVVTVLLPKIASANGGEGRRSGQINRSYQWLRYFPAG